MRDIKFRAWDKIHNKMLIVMTLSRREQTPFCLCRDEIRNMSLAMPSIDLEFMQFTGLKDKNGKDIYEGDIVSRHEIKYTVEWDNGDVRFIGRGISQEGIFTIHCWGEKQEVIGNIYENPELLKKEYQGKP